MPLNDRMVVTVTAAFGTLRAFDDDRITKQLRTFGAYSRTGLAFLCSVIEAGDHVFDIGAHIGTFAIPLAQRTGPDGKLVAVEAQPETFELLSENISANGLSDRVITISSVVGPASINYASRSLEGNSGGTYFVPTDAEQGSRAVTLDEITQRTVVPDVIKIDIEGLEFAVLEQSAVVRERRPILYSEVSADHLARYGATIGDLNRLLAGLGYRLFRNAADRNVAHDRFQAVEMNELMETSKLYDVLAVAHDSRRLPWIRP